MKYDRATHHRCSIRLSGYDYSQAGAYFITMGTQNRQCLFGQICDGMMRSNDAGGIAQQCWNEIPIHFPHLELDEFVIMPNHVHGIVMITDAAAVGRKIFRPYNRPRAEQRNNPVEHQKPLGPLFAVLKSGLPNGCVKTRIFMTYGSAIIGNILCATNRN